MFDVAAIRRQFPALQQAVNGRLPTFLDGPGGTQVPQSVIDAMVRYLTISNANRGGMFRTSRVSDEILHEAHEAVADFLNAADAAEIVFGNNMTTLTFAISRALGRTWKPGDEVVVTRLDHDANIRPWVLAAADAGATVRWVDIHPEDCTLDEEDFGRQLSPRTKLVALTCASNVVGSMPDVAKLTHMAHAAGALVYLDAVHYGPHGPIDVRAWNCDFLACSAYKFFGPHVGILWGRREVLDSLPAYKVRPAANSLPDRWMTGTQNHEGIAGVTAAVDYLASLGTNVGNRHRKLHAAMTAIQQYESTLVGKLLAGLCARPRFRIWGITESSGLSRRAPTVALTCRDRTPQQLAEQLGKHDTYSWNGNMYAIELCDRLGVEQTGGVLRLGLAHYNTPEEVERALEVLDEA